MALLFQNSLIRIADYIKISREYSSPQSISRAKAKGIKKVKVVGGLDFIDTSHLLIDKIFSVASWQGLPLIEAEKLPTDLITISRISKTIGVGEATIIEWGLFNRMDVYWICGTYFANLLEAKQLAPERKKALNVSLKK